jgi:16S rRNA (guanine527-N7)-methyltransferase
MPERDEAHDRGRALALLDVSRETAERLTVYVDLLRRWQAKVQLVSAGDLPQLWWRHVADSGQLLRLAPADARIWADVGSGGGFPGLVLAILASGRPGAVFHLIESDQRKAAFLRTVSRETGAPAVVHADRAERVIPTLGAVGVVASRATASLAQLIAWTAPLVDAGALGLFPRGENVRAELTELPSMLNMTLALQPSLTRPAASIVKVQRVSP